MKIRKGSLILYSIAGALIVLLLICLVHYSHLKIDNKHASLFKQNLLRVMAEQTAFQMADVTDFDWDTVYVLRPYTFRDEMFLAIGKEWTTRSFLGYYLLKNTIFDKYPLDNDSLNKFVFLNGDQVVVDITLDRSEVDLTYLNQVIPRNEAFFIVDDKHILRTYKIIDQ